MISFNDEIIDVFGLNPVSLEEAIIPEDVVDADNYLAFREESLFKEPGTHFTVSKKEWFVILNLMVNALTEDESNLPFMKEGRSIIDGEINGYYKGCSSREMCDYIYTKISEKICKPLKMIDDKNIYINTLSWNTFSNENGKMIIEDVSDKLILMHPELQKIGEFFSEDTLPVINGKKHYSTVFMTVSKLDEFLNFLNNCGGFEVIQN